MRLFCFATGQSNLPHAANPDRAALGFERWREAVAQAGDSGLTDFAEAVMRDTGGRRLLEAVFGNSLHLTLSAVKDPGFLREILTAGPDAACAGVMSGLRRAGNDGLDGDRLARDLRVAKRRVALAVAVADIAGAWSLEQVTGALSDFAELALSRAAGHLLRAAAAGGAFTLPDADDPEKGSGLVVLGMGKLGARELNYSSDIDLIVLYDNERIRTDRPEELHNHFVRLTRSFMRLMDERTADGYVFRTDLRLRPDPGATPVALSALAAETYYESLGQNWERAAMIKARPVAGDREAGAAFLERLTPFVWRKNLDFAAIQDIHSIKRQINAHRGGGTIALAGHNIKLGRGGIREIEFFVQTQQLIWGGREPELRCIATVDALRALAAKERIAPQTADDLIAVYRYLRRVEHRLQMVDDEQTHTLPADEAGLRDLAAFLGYADAQAFGSDLLAHLRRVETHYSDLFEHAPALGAQGLAAGNLVFTGSEADPETIKTIGRLGYKNPQTVDAAVRGWHHGRYRAMRSTRARELLTELMPALLKALAGTPEPDKAFLKFDEFLSGLPAGVQLFSMFHSNPHLLDLVAEIMGQAPRLAAHLSRRPSVLDSVLTADFFDTPPPPAALAGELDGLLDRAGDFEDVLDNSRRWANDRKFQVGVQSLRGHLAPRAAAAALSNIAEAALNRLQPRVEKEFARQHGRVAGSAMAIVAMGKLGGREMTATSDLDLIFIYTAEQGAAASDGPKALPPSQYFARLSQRLIGAVTAQTAEGRLYEVDMRLRPSGSVGPIACSHEAFVRYHEKEAWTWEHMALTRARVIAGPAALHGLVDTALRETLTRSRDAGTLLTDVAEMRARMDSEHHTDLIWKVKHLRGGLVDVEFITQYLELKHAHAHPEILSPNTRTALRRLRDTGLLAAPVADDLIEGLDLWQAIQGLLRLTIEDESRRAADGEIPEGLHETLARVGGAVDFVALKEKVTVTAGRLHRHFVDLIEAPARAVADRRSGDNGRRENGVQA